MSQEETTELKAILEAFQKSVQNQFAAVHQEFVSVHKKLDKISTDIESIDKVMSFREQAANLNGVKPLRKAP